MPRKESLVKRIDLEAENIGKIKKKRDKKPEKGIIRPEHYFILSSGGIIKDIKDLALNLDGIDDADFYYHVSSEKNDFSNWIKDIIKDKKLAHEISQIKNKKDTQIALLKHILKKD